MQINEQPEVVKELQLHNDDATVQRLDEQSFPIQRGFYYQVPHTPLHPRGWHLRLYLKRKKLRRSNQLYAATDRIGTRWSLLPLCFFMLMLIITAGSFFTGFNSFVSAVDQRYQGQVATLVDILPKDSLRMYDEHGTMIYEA